MGWIRIIVILAVAIFLIHLLLTWLEGRGWIYYRTHRPPMGAAAGAMLEFESIYNPPAEHVIEFQKEIGLPSQTTDQPVEPAEDDTPNTDPTPHN
jgi:hypothetical protein